MENPYLPGSHAVEPSALSPETETMGAVVEMLAKTKPWMKACAAVGTALAGIMLLASVGGAMAAAAMASRGVGAIALSATQSFISLLVGLAYLFLSIKLWKCSRGISRLMASASPADLLQALDRQRGFWKTAALMVVLGVLLMMLLVMGLTFFTVPVEPR